MLRLIDVTGGDTIVKYQKDSFIERLYQAYYMDVYSYVMTIMKNPTDAEEVTQETFFRAMRSRFKGKSGELTWLCSIAKNLCMDIFRKENKKVPLDEMEFEDKLQLEEKFVSKTESLEIHKQLHSLEEPYKEIFSLRVFGELSFKEIGEIFGKTENWARVTYHRGKLKLQEKLKK